MIVIGIDESGRGCCAGSIFAGAIAFLNDDIDFKNILVDSKTTNKNKRKIIFDKIKKSSNILSAYSLRTAEEVDTYGIQKCNNDVMISAAGKVYDQLINMGYLDKDIHIIADGTLKINLNNKKIESVIKADATIKEVSAASIVAKYMKDIEMENLEKTYPNFKFSEHSGYCNVKHMLEVDKYGTLPGVHRFSYSPIKIRK
jgi:ribonuclease HII